ncbi:hypothetical protein KM043_016371 [Ampulex compressa]|nr:hypothetical protein KM043_016371 [Ampulex compressa]
MTAVNGITSRPPRRGILQFLLQASFSISCLETTGFPDRQSLRDQRWFHGRTQISLHEKNSREDLKSPFEHKARFIPWNKKNGTFLSKAAARIRLTTLKSAQS